MPVAYLFGACPVTRYRGLAHWHHSDPSQPNTVCLPICTARVTKQGPGRDQAHPETRCVRKTAQETACRAGSDQRGRVYPIEAGFPLCSYLSPSPKFQTGALVIQASGPGPWTLGQFFNGW